MIVLAINCAALRTAEEVHEFHEEHFFVSYSECVAEALKNLEGKTSPQHCNKEKRMPVEV